MDETRMNRRPPAHIAEAGLSFDAPDYVWNNQTDEEVVFHQPRIANRINEMSDRAGLAFSLGAIEWTLWRFHKLLPDDHERVFQFLDAAWAGIVDWKYLDAFISSPWEETLDREIGGPLAASFSCLEWAFGCARDRKPFMHEPVAISEVALRVCGVPEVFKAWRRTVIERLIEVAPKDPSERLGQPLPRDIVSPMYTPAPDKDGERINAYLQSLDWQSSPFLGKPEEMKAAGFEGEPYRWPSSGSAAP